MPKIVPVTATSHVLATAFLGHTAFFAGADGDVLIHPEDGEARTVTAHGGGLLAAIFDPATKRLVTSGEDGRVAALGADGTVETLSSVKGKWIDALALGPQGAIGFSSGRTAWVRLADGTLKEFPHAKAVGGITFLPKGFRIATATVDKAVLHWVTAQGAPVDLEWKGAHTGITTSPDGRFLVTCMQETALHGWRIEDAKHMRMTGYPAKVKSVSWSVKGKWLATAGANAAILWPFVAKDGPMGKPPMQLGPNEKLVTQVACHPSEEVVAIGYDNGLVLAVRFEDSAEVVLRHPGNSAISALAWSADGLRMAFGCDDGEAGVVDITVV